MHAAEAHRAEARAAYLAKLRAFSARCFGQDQLAYVRETAWVEKPEAMEDADPEPLPVLVGMTLEAAERVLIAATVENTGWNIAKSAAMLGIDRSTLYAKLSRYGIAKRRPDDAPGHER